MPFYGYVLTRRRILLYQRAVTYELCLTGAVSHDITRKAYCSVASWYKLTSKAFISCRAVMSLYIGRYRLGRLTTD